MENRFSNLRKCLFETKEELMRFRQLIVNVVLGECVSVLVSVLVSVSE